MSNEYTLLSYRLKLPTLFLLLFIIFIIFFLTVFLSTCTAAVKTPWEIGSGEYLTEGHFLGIQDNNIHIGTNIGELLLPLEPHAFIALMGNQYGQLVFPEDFPLGQNVELFITRQGTVRAMRNKLSNFVLPEGEILPGWGHSASLSPDGKHYLIYNLQSGLSLYSLSPGSSPLFLSYYNIAAWNKSGNKVVYSGGEDLFIFDIDRNKTLRLPLEKAAAQFALIITGLDLNYCEDKLLFTSLQDDPDLGSDVFQITVLDINGEQLAVKIVPNLAAVAWLKNDLILYVTYDNIEQDIGQALLWDFRTGETSVFLPEKKGGYHNLCVSSEKEKLAYTVSRGAGQELYVINTSNGSPVKILSLPLPVRNMQWSNHDTLFYWDFMNNHIYEVKDLHHSCSPVVRANGYLPAGAAKDKLIYFLSEPWEEPQQPFLLD